MSRDVKAATPLAAALAAHIKKHGAMSVMDFMALALGHPRHGYYMRGEPFGAAGDFITAPEVSQMFGELIGLWCADYWRRMGAPADIKLVELGPGRGTLMADALRAAAKIAPEFRGALALHLVETSPALCAVQARRLEAIWHARFDAVPEGPLLLVANEVFDALPIRQLIHCDDGWRERCVSLEGDAFRFVAGARVEGTPPALHHEPPGSICELNPRASEMAGAIGKRLAAYGGAALIVDYGYDGYLCGDTLQAVERHAFVDPLARPGMADLTAHVNFAALRDAARAAGAVSHGPVSQHDFLTALGIRERAATLLKESTETERRSIEAALDRLIGKAAMGDLFKALAITAPQGPQPAGF